METFIIIIHILTSFFLIAIVLLQSGKGAQMGATFGGSSQTLFGSRGAATILNKITTIAAIVFMLTSLTLTIVTTKSASVIKQAPVEQKKAIPQQLPAQPQQPAIPQQPVNK